MTNAQAIARAIALDILKAYHSKITGSTYSPETRERAQAAAFEAAEKQIRAMQFKGKFASDLNAACTEEA